MEWMEKGDQEIGLFRCEIFATRVLHMRWELGVFAPMNTVVQVPDGETPCTISEVVAALREQEVEARHQKKDWGDWLTLRGSQTVISIEAIRGLTSTATIEHDEDEADDLALRLQQAFHGLGWEGIDEDGPYPLA
jgi:hypothetical protein